MPTQTSECNTNFKNKKMKILKSIHSLFRSNEFEQTDEEVLKILEDGARRAIEIGKDLNYKLDYSEGSIKTVDKILNRIKTVFKDKNDLSGFALVYGLYIIEVFERNHQKGYLKKRYDNHGPDDFPYYRKKELIFPCLWCYDIIFQSDAKDIWSQYQSAILED